MSVFKMYNVREGDSALNMYQNSNTDSSDGGRQWRGKWKSELTRKAEVKGKAKNKMAV